MKTKYYLATGVLACSAVSGLVMPLANTFAVGTGSQTQDVTVGEVDETVYSVDINWGDMTFDWKYDYSTNAFSFVEQITCSELAAVGGSPEEPEPSITTDFPVFQDNACTEPFTAPYSGQALYAELKNYNTIDVTDHSSNGRVKARVSFSPENDYSWVAGRFSSVAYLDNNGNFSQDLNNGYLLGIASGQDDVTGLPSATYNGILYLEGDSAHITSDSVHAGDKIGTVTLTIEPDLN